MLCQSHFSTKKTLEGNESAKIRDEMAKDLLKYLPTLVSPPQSDYWILPELFGMKDNEDIYQRASQDTRWHSLFRVHYKLQLENIFDANGKGWRVGGLGGSLGDGQYA